MRISRTTGNNSFSSYSASLDIVFLHKVILEGRWRASQIYVTLDVYISNSNDITVDDCYRYLRYNINATQNYYYSVNGVRAFSSGSTVIYGCRANTSTSITFFEYGSMNAGSGGVIVSNELEMNNSDLTIAAQRCIEIAHLK